MRNFSRLFREINHPLRRAEILGGFIEYILAQGRKSVD
jgi:hypothetical protein